MNERSSADSCVLQRIMTKTETKGIYNHLNGDPDSVCKQQIPDKTDTEYGTGNDNVQILFSPGCEQPLRDNKDDA